MNPNKLILKSSMAAFSEENQIAVPQDRCMVGSAEQYMAEEDARYTEETEK